MSEIDGSASIPSSSGTPTLSRSPNAIWTHEQELAFVRFLAGKRDKAGDGTLFPKQIWMQAALEMAKYPTTGAPKTWTVCKAKWGRIKDEFNTVDTLLNRTSGMGWNLFTGIGITPQNQHILEPVWNAYIAKHPKAKKFKNKGFDLYEEVRTFVRGTQKGGRVYHPSTSAGVPSATLTDTSPESVAADLDQNPGDVHPAGDLIDPTDAGTSNGQDLIPSSDAPLPPSSPPPLEISFQNESVSGESNRSTRKRKQMASAPPPNRSFSLESSPADSPFSTPQNSDMGGKRSRVTGPVVLSGIKEELSSFRSAYSSKTETKLGMIKDIITRKTSADYRQEARKLFQQLEPDLGDQATIHVMTLLQSDKNAEMYVDFARDSLRKAWVQEHINHTGLG